MDSVILPEGVKERILADIDEFLKGERWYVDRGKFDQCRPIARRLIPGLFQAFRTGEATSSPGYRAAARPV